MNWLVLAFISGVVTGHGAIFVWAYNRINATGLPRYQVKRIEKGILALFVLLPAWLLYTDGQVAWRALTSSADLLWKLTLIAQCYSIICWLSLIALLPRWVVGRLEYWSQKAYEPRIQRNVLDMKSKIGPELFKPKWLKAVAQIPGNQVRYLEFNIKQLPVAKLPTAWEGFKIAHLSDLHLTGWFDDRYTRYAIEQMLAHKPDMFCISGDLIDYDSQIENVLAMLRDVNPTLGKYFVLGNHDRRIDRPELLRQKMTDQGWMDLGYNSHTIDLGQRHIQLFGNERPWFDARQRNISEREILQQPVPPNLLRIGVSHSPDQVNWGLEIGCNVLLCGHTHGGQVRVPLIGPIISPAWTGSRYASGIFQQDNQTMHVSRGLSGTQPLRFRCMPEASVLHLHRVV